MNKMATISVMNKQTVSLLRWLPLFKRTVHNTSTLTKSGRFNIPLPGTVVPEFGGIATMMRLPLQPDNPEGLNACFVGIPMDNGTSWRSGTRHGPRMIRHESTVLGPHNRMTGAAPFESLQVADIGDVSVNPYNLSKSLDNITKVYKKILSIGCIPLGIGGDHTLALGVLRAIGAKYGPVGMIQVDAHADVNDTMFGEKIAHGTPFRRAVEEGLIDPNYVVQIGLRGGGYSPYDFNWPKEKVCKQYVVILINITIIGFSNDHG